MRALPAAAVLVVGLSLAVRLVLDGSGQTRTVWWPVPLIAFFGLVVLLDRGVRVPRPRFDKRVGQAQWKQAFAAAAKAGSLPAHREVRTAVGVVACSNLEGLVIGCAMFIAFLLCAPIAPAFPWLAALGAPVVLTGIDVVRAPRAWAYLRALHTADRTG
ncbi:hypothetical protein [Kocuria sabuli]|uniref:hypothetical protein n=1 Tax=Kocuria sabuli TaxID=3071448 RepID=UPI0034D6E379